jgi:argininosuccinate lyase
MEGEFSMKESNENILHDGRLGSYSAKAAKYTASTDIDNILLSSVIKINSAHMIMLAEQGIVDRKIAADVLRALSVVPENFEMNEDLEDAHMNVENYVIAKIGKDEGGMMNLAKSRNDQVATALRMVLRDKLIELGESIISLEKSLLEQANKHAKTILPGYTHLQRGQPITLGHQLLAHFDSIDRDFSRLIDCYLRMDLSPMGAGALASTGFQIDRSRVADLLGFAGILENSMDAVSSRDFATEAIYVCAQSMNDLSRLAEELVLWSTREFSFAEMPDEFSSTSSMMPQKKNAIVPEIFRARTSQVLGDLVGAMGVTKSLPLTYNLDLQELTRNLWSGTEKASFSISILSDVVRGTEFNEDKMRESGTTDQFLYATELADLLVQKFHLSFRDAHSRVGKLVRFCTEQGLSATQFSDLGEQKVSEILGVSLSSQNLSSVLDPVATLSKKVAVGSPSPKLVLSACKVRENIVEKHERTLSSFKDAIAESDRLLGLSAQEFIQAVAQKDAKWKGKAEVKQ